MVEFLNPECRPPPYTGFQCYCERGIAACYTRPTPYTGEFVNPLFRLFGGLKQNILPLKFGLLHYKLKLNFLYLGEHKHFHASFFQSCTEHVRCASKSAFYI